MLVGFPGIIDVPYIGDGAWVCCIPPLPLSTSICTLKRSGNFQHSVYREMRYSGDRRLVHISICIDMLMITKPAKEVL